MSVAIPPEALAARFPTMFEEADPEAPAVLLGLLQRRAVAAGEALLSTGRQSSELMLIWEGHFTVTAGPEAGPIELGEVGQGDWVGEITFIEPGEPSADVVASRDGVVLSLGHGELRQLIAEHPSVARSLLHALNQDLIRRLREIDSGVVSRFGGGLLVADEPAPAERRGWLSGLWSRLVTGGSS